MEQNFSEKFPEIPKAVEYPKCEPFNQKLKKFGERSQLERKLPLKFFENLGIAREVVLIFENFEKRCSIRYWKLPKI